MILVRAAHYDCDIDNMTRRGGGRLPVHVGPEGLRPVRNLAD